MISFALRLARVTAFAVALLSLPACCGSPCAPPCPSPAPAPSPGDPCAHPMFDVSACPCLRWSGCELCNDCPDAAVVELRGSCEIPRPPWSVKCVLDVTIPGWSCLDPRTKAPVEMHVEQGSVKACPKEPGPPEGPLLRALAFITFVKQVRRLDFHWDSRPSAPLPSQPLDPASWGAPEHAALAPGDVLDVFPAAYEVTLPKPWPRAYLGAIVCEHTDGTIVVNHWPGSQGLASPGGLVVLGAQSDPHDIEGNPIPPPGLHMVLLHGTKADESDLSLVTEPPRTAVPPPPLPLGPARRHRVERWEAMRRVR
jgi:hypothetical protein